MNLILKYLILLILVCSINLFSQSADEPVYNKEIYFFLDNQASKGIIKIFDAIRPYTRLTIAEKLLELSNKVSALSNTEKEQLDFYKSEYAFEIKFIEKDTTEISEFFKSGDTDRFKLYKYYDSNFTLDVDPVFGLGYDFSKKNYHQYGGIKFKGRISSFLGYYFDYRDNLEKGDNLDFRKRFAPETGVIISKSDVDKIEYSETRGGLTLGWDWGEFTMAKDFINIGSGYQSNVILSSKAPSFPFIKLDISPVKWFHYNFIHAWLNSDLIDSNSIRYTGVTSTYVDRSLSYSSRQKFYVSHSLSFEPFESWWLTFGESIIYSDQIEFIYFLPVFYRLADHYNSMGGGDTGDNAQIFFNTSYRWEEIKSKFYLSLYIDEFSPESIFSGGDNAQVYAVTLGGKFTNPFWSDSYFTLEYSALKPYSYMNGDPAQTYFSSGYQLGHWVGSNSVQYYFLFEQYIARPLKIEAMFQLIKKGSKEDINDYYNRVTSTYPLLSGDVSTYSELGIKISYSPFHDLFFTIDYRNVFNSDGRFENEFSVKKGSSFSTTINYGF